VTRVAASTPSPARPREDSTALVIGFVRDRIARGEVRPGDRLPPERELATRLGVSRPTVRAGLRALSAMGVVESRHGSGTFITGGPPRLGTEPLAFLADLHGFTREEMYEARRVLEVGVAGLAADRVTPDHLASIAEEVASLFASMNDPEAFLVHDIRFHRMVAQCAGNPLLASLVEMVSALYYERRRVTATRATDRNLQDAAEMHRRIYQAIRSRDASLARRLMQEHLTHSAAFQAEEEQRSGQTAPVPLGPKAERPKRGRASANR
jgi:GntR family transcriptional repressor for pyruvate dehydrogenase complex